MTTAVTTTLAAQDTVAHFNAWFNEIITQLLAVGLTQTTDTGQISTGGAVAIPAANTAAGYTIWKFNDTLQSTKPVFIKLEFGSSSATNYPGIWITVGQGSNGSGTLTGVLTTRTSVVNAQLASPITTSWVSRWCYNATYGVLWMNWKQGAWSPSYPTSSMGCFYVGRSNDSTGASTGDAVVVITNSSTATGSNTNTGYMQVYSYLTGALVNATPSIAWNVNILALSTTLISSNNYLSPVLMATPAPAILFGCAMAALSELGLNATVSVAPVGATPQTFIQLGVAFGGNGGVGNIANLLWGFVALWL